MDVSQRTTTIAGLAMIALVILTIVVFALTVSSMGEKDPFQRDEVPEFLADLEDNADILQAGNAIGIINDAFISLLVGAALYILFRDRNPLLATVALIGIAITSAISLVVDVTNIMLVEVAKDYVRGGAEGVPAGDASTLELGRYLGMLTTASFVLIGTPLGVAIMAIGALLAGAPQGLINPPKWIGWIAIVSGACAELSWLVVASGVFFVFLPIAGILSLIFLLALGIWLLRHSDLQPAPMKA